jgi:superfamily I DNA/RNA helicase
MLSDKQEKVLETWIKTDQNILISAVAGSGKSFTLIEILKNCNYKTLFLAFNKSIQQEIEEKINMAGLRQGKAMTLHSLGLSAIKKRYRCNIVSTKNFDLIKILQNQEKDIFKRMNWEDKLKLTYGFCDMNDISRMFLITDLKEIGKQMLSMDKTLPTHSKLPELWEKFLAIRDASYRKSIVDIDFIDMIYLPVLESLYIPIDPTYLLIDECQDLSMTQHLLVKNLINQGNVKKFIAVGDRNQAIYGFSGAMSSSFDLFLNYPNTIELPLDICYRCDSNIIASANKVYDVMLPFKESLGIVDEISDAYYIKENSMVICRNTKPLIDLYFGLLGWNKNVYLKGDDILSGLIKFLKPYNTLTVKAARIEMGYKLQELEKNQGEEAKMKLYFFKEDYEKYKKISEKLSVDTDKISVLLLKIQELFKVKEKDSIVLCTIHKSKGLEADVVYILNENLIPSKFAKSEEQLKQEMNLKYVARTRAKKEMYFLNIN